MMPWKSRRRLKKLKEQGVSIDKLPDDPEFRCGYAMFSTGPNDPFISCCTLHDIEYGKNEDGTQNLSRRDVDLKFKQCMLKIANGNTLLKVRAYTYYRLVRIFGGLIW